MSEDGRRRLGLEDGASQRAPEGGGRGRCETDQNPLEKLDAIQHRSLRRPYCCLPAPDDVFLEQLLNDVGNVGHVDLVDETVDGLLQSLPAHPLIGETA